MKDNKFSIFIILTMLTVMFLLLFYITNIHNAYIIQNHEMGMEELILEKEIALINDNLTKIDSVSLREHEYNNKIICIHAIKLWDQDSQDYIYTNTYEKSTDCYEVKE